MKLIRFDRTRMQIEERTQRVTRRIGPREYKAGDVLHAVAGEDLDVLAKIKIISVTQEQLSRLIDFPFYGKLEAWREGFPELSGIEFVEMFCLAHGCSRSITVTRIEFEYVEDDERK
jgi:hypothetical protein